MCRQREWPAAVVLAVALGTGLAVSAFAGAGRQGASILDLPHRSVRAAALGEAFSAYHGDVNTVLWNPGGLADLDKKQIVSGWSSFEQVFDEAGEGLYHALFAGALPIEGVGVLGATLQLNGQGTIELTRDSPEVLGVESLGTNWVLGMTYAERVRENLRVGLTGKVIRLVLGTGFEQGSSATSYAADLGVQYDARIGLPFTLAASAMNVGTRVQFKDANQSDPLPRQFHGGLAATVYERRDLRLTVSADIVAAIDKLRQNVHDEDFVETVAKRMGLADPKSAVRQRVLEELVEFRLGLPEYAGRSREDVQAQTVKDRDAAETQLKKDRGAGIYAFAWDRLDRALGAEATVMNTLAVRGGLRFLDPDSESLDLDLMDRLSFGFGLNLSDFGLPFYLDYANGLWGGGGPLGRRVNTFALSARF